MKKRVIKDYKEKLGNSKFGLGELVWFNGTHPYTSKKVNVIGVITGITENKYEGVLYYRYDIQTNIYHYYLIDESRLNKVDDTTKINIES